MQNDTCTAPWAKAICCHTDCWSAWRTDSHWYNWLTIKPCNYKTIRKLSCYIFIYTLRLRTRKHSLCLLDTKTIKKHWHLHTSRWPQSGCEQRIYVWWLFMRNTLTHMWACKRIYPGVYWSEMLRYKLTSVCTCFSCTCLWTCISFFTKTKRR